ncbi:MAG: anaerobic ribonucleoside-triphosphate reductase activating protein [Raoultibacter sp.]
MADQSPHTIPIRLFGTVGDSIVDGPGLRYSVFVQGCSHRCPGCHNPESQSVCSGYESSVGAVLAEIKAHKLTRSVTLSGGEPFEQCAACLALARCLRADGYDVWIYSGYRFEDLVAGKPDPLALDLLHLCDVLIDGPFIESLNSYELAWCGSSNQRVIDLRKSFAADAVVLWEHHESFPIKPQSW